LEVSHFCVVDAGGVIVKEARVASEPEAIVAWFAGLGLDMEAIGLEAGPLSQWLYAAMTEAELPAVLLETRQVRGAFRSMPVKTDRKDARGIAQLMRLGWYRQVHCKSQAAQENRTLLCRAQDAPVALHRHRDVPARTVARLWLEGGADQAHDL
jgi:transposase